MTEPTVAKTETVVLKRCPFCNMDMSVIGQRIWHPQNYDCILHSFSFRDTEMSRQMWNKRVER